MRSTRRADTFRCGCGCSSTTLRRDWPRCSGRWREVRRLFRFGRPGALPLHPAGAVGPRPHFICSETGIGCEAMGRTQSSARLVQKTPAAQRLCQRRHAALGPGGRAPSSAKPDNFIQSGSTPLVLPSAYRKAAFRSKRLFRCRFATHLDGRNGPHNFGPVGGGRGARRSTCSMASAKRCRADDRGLHGPVDPSKRRLS